MVTAALFGTVYWATSSYARNQLTESIQLEGYELVGEAGATARPISGTINARLLASGEPDLACR